MKRQIFLLATLLLIGAGCRETIDESLWPIFSLEGPEGAVVVPPGDLTVSAREIVFADQLVNAKSSAQVITVQNAGSVPVTIISITHSGGEFTQRNNCPVGQLLQLGEICSIEIFFDPTADGVRGGAVQIVDSTSASPRIITLSGRGVVGPSVTSVEVVGADPGIGSNGSGSESDASGSEPPLSPPSEGGVPESVTSPKLIALGETNSAVDRPVPDSGITFGLSPEFEATVSVPVKAPEVVGAKPTIK